MYALERLEQGYTVVLPGCMGNKALDPNVIKGLTDADIPSAIEMYDWTNGSANLLYNLRGLKRNRREAKRIVDYQDKYPGWPVYLVGYSGGAGLAVMALEELPAERSVSSVVLIAPALMEENPSWSRPATRVIRGNEVQIWTRPSSSGRRSAGSDFDHCRDVRLNGPG